MTTVRENLFQLTPDGFGFRLNPRGQDAIRDWAYEKSSAEILPLLSWNRYSSSIGLPGKDPDTPTESISFSSRAFTLTILNCG